MPVFQPSWVLASTSLHSYGAPLCLCGNVRSKPNLLVVLTHLICRLLIVSQSLEAFHLSEVPPLCHVQEQWEYRFHSDAHCAVGAGVYGRAAHCRKKVCR
ncbi:hypothetical protein F5146DRAFT_1065567 [Armillaria mellea]|nr:hypothetical protein F5146DRAFT_1065567 [Armillaria mellea]